MSNVSVVFDADTGKFRANVDGATASVQKSAEMVAKAKTAVLQWGQQSIQTAQEAGASTERLASIQEKTAARLASISEKNANRVIAALDRQAQKAREVAAEMANLNKVVDISTARNGLGDVPNRLKTSTVLRVSEGSTSIRGAEAFISAVPALAALSDVVFPVAAAAGFVAIAGQGVEKLKEMYDTAQKIPDSIRSMFESVNAPILQNVDTLRRDNDQLEITIAHLEHKPANNLALALDEARLNADKLTESADKAFEQVTKLMQENKSGFFAYAATGAIDDPYRDEIQKRMQAYRDLAQANRDALHSGNDTPEAAQARSAQMQSSLRGIATWAHGERTGIQSFDNGQARSSIEDLRGVENWAQDTADLQDEQTRNTSDQGKVKQLEGAKQLAGDTNKAKEQQLKALTDYVNVWRTMAPVSSKAIFDYWESQKASFAHAPQELEQINAKLAELATEGASKAHEAIAKYQEAQKRQSGEVFAPRVLNVLGNTAESGRALSEEGARSALGSTQIAAELARTKVQIDLANGSISKMTADQKLAAISADEHAQRLAFLRQQLADFQKSANSYNSVLGLYSNDKEQQTYVGLTANIAKEAGAQQVDAMQNSAKQAADAWEGSLKNAFNQWLQHAQDTAGQVRELFAQSVNGLNDNLVNLMSGDYKKGDFKKYGKNLFKTGSKDLLEQGESRLFGHALGGKPDGSESKPFYVKLAKDGEQMLQGIKGLFGGKGSNSQPLPLDGGSQALGKLLWPNGAPSLPSVNGGGSDNQNVASGVGGFFASLLGSLFGGHRALGGGVQAGVAYDVGEMGRETFVPSTDGTIIPNSKLGGGDTHYTVQVANGVTPEQMAMHVQEALRQFHPQVVRDSVSATHDYQRRNPSSHR